MDTIKNILTIIMVISTVGYFLYKLTMLSGAVAENLKGNEKEADKLTGEAYGKITLTLLTVSGLAYLILEYLAP